jgi:hypothetical protein
MDGLILARQLRSSTTGIMKRITALLLALLAFDCTSQSSSQADSDEAFRRHGFPSFETARHLCQQRVYAADTEILWDALTTEVPPDRAVSFYTERLGKKARTREADGWTWRLPVGAQQPERVLALHAVTADGPWKRCDQSIPSGAKTVIVLSTITRTRK